MTVIGGVGQSGNTRIKLAQLPEIFSIHLAITQAVLQKNKDYFKPDYLYIDATSGPGIYENIPELGSPMCFANTINELRQPLPYKAHLIDIQQDLLFLLSSRLKERFSNFNFSTYIGEYQEKIPLILPGYDPYQLGLIFIDPNNFPDLDTVKYITEHRKRMEILLYVSAANMKRTHQSIVSYTQDAKKYCWLIREPQDKHQWTFMMGTTFMLRDKFRKPLGMYPIDSTPGKRILEDCGFTHKEIKQQCLKYQKFLIEPTENT